MTRLWRKQASGDANLPIEKEIHCPACLRLKKYWPLEVSTVAKTSRTRQTIAASWVGRIKTFCRLWKQHSKAETHLSWRIMEGFSSVWSFFWKSHRTCNDRSWLLNVVTAPTGQDCYDITSQKEPTQQYLQALHSWFEYIRSKSLLLVSVSFRFRFSVLHHPRTPCQITVY